MAANTTPRTTVTEVPSSAAAAIGYRNLYPLPSPIRGIFGLLRNTRLSLFRKIDTSKSIDDQIIESRLYIEFAILGGEAFLAESWRLGVPQHIIRFVRHEELPRLKRLRHIEPEGLLFIEAMKRNTGWLNSLLPVIEELREQRAQEEQRR